MSRVGLGDHLTQLRDGSSGGPQAPLCCAKTPAAPTRGEPFTDRVGEVASFFRGRGTAIGSPGMTARTPQYRIWLSLHPRPSRGRGRSPRRSTAGPPQVAYRDAAARGQGPGQQGGAATSRAIARLRRLAPAVVALAWRRAWRCRRAPRAHRRRHLARLCILVGEGGVEPGQPFPDAAPCEPQWLQRRRQLQTRARYRSFRGPRECRAQVVDLGFACPRRCSAGTCRAVEQGRHGRVVIAVTGARRRLA